MQTYKIRTGSFKKLHPISPTPLTRLPKNLKFVQVKNKKVRVVPVHSKKVHRRAEVQLHALLT
jgi:hypothetical protein